MDWSAIGAVADLLGAAAVLLTLLYLAKQIRQTNIISRFNAENALLARLDDLNRLIVTDAETRRVLSNKGPLTNDEQEHLYAYADSLCNTYASAESAYKAGLIDEQLFGSIRHDLEVAMQRWPQIRDQIEVWLNRYPGGRTLRIFEALIWHSGSGEQWGISVLARSRVGDGWPRPRAIHCATNRPRVVTSRTTRRAA